jgi:benzoate-CoA ligase
VPAIANAALGLLKPNLLKRPEKVALRSGAEGVTHRELFEYSQRFAQFLSARIRERGTRVALVLPDGFSFYYSFLGSLLAGQVPVLLNPGLQRDDYAIIFEDVGVQTLVTTPGSVAATVGLEPVLVSSDRAFVQELPALDPAFLPYSPNVDDVAFVLMSSGSTGRPKGVPHRHDDIRYAFEVYGRPILELTEKDVVFSTSKLFFTYGFGTSIYLPLSAGSTVVLNPDRPTPQTILRILREERPTLFCGVPSIYSTLLRCLDGSEDLASVRLWISAGEALPDSLYNEWKMTTGVEILDNFGSTEALCPFVANRPGAVVPGSCGRVVPPFELKIVDEAGHPQTPGQSGELLVRGASLFPYYWNQPEKTASTILPDGWVRTGDVFVERDGVYFHQGRADDLFKVEAQWVAPAKIETVLRTHPAVTECAVVGKPVSDMLRPWAFVVLAPGFVPGGELIAEIRDFLRARIPIHMIPVSFKFLDALPRTATGKIQRLVLKNT